VKSALALRAKTWVIGPLFMLAVGGALGQRRADAERGRFYAEPAALPKAERRALESAPALAVANATWAFGSADSVQKMLRFELDRLPQSEGQALARTLVRFGILARNPEGQAAVFGQACNADPSICNHEKDAALRELQARFVAPGNQLPLYFIPNHPPVFGP